MPAAPRIALFQFGNPPQGGLQLTRRLANRLLQGRVRLRQCAHLGTQTSFSTRSARGLDIHHGDEYTTPRWNGEQLPLTHPTNTI